MRGNQDRTSLAKRASEWTGGRGWGGVVPVSAPRGSLPWPFMAMVLMLASRMSAHLPEAQDTHQTLALNNLRQPIPHGQIFPFFFRVNYNSCQTNSSNAVSFCPHKSPTLPLPQNALWVLPESVTPEFRFLKSQIDTGHCFRASVCVFMYLCVCTIFPSKNDTVKINFKNFLKALRKIIIYVK